MVNYAPPMRHQQVGARCSGGLIDSVEIALPLSDENPLKPHDGPPF